MADAAERRFDLVICEAIDRLGRRLADTADLQDQLAFQGIRLYTPSLGEITHIHVAVMGMMAQMALKDLGEKTKRGQLGRVLKGRIPAGIAYGYKTAASGADGRGARTIDADEANVVRRIFREFACGKSPEAIARDLNREGVRGPGGRLWSNTTLRGQVDRGTGILNNSLYRGIIEWNRCAYAKNPSTGKRVARPNPLDRWERVEVPELRIVDEDLWLSVKTRQGALRQAMGKALPRNKVDANPNRLNEAHRPRFLLSGLLSCGCCGGPYAITAKDRYACSTRKQKGTCDNRLTITRQEIEARVLEAGRQEHRRRDRRLRPRQVEDRERELQRPEKPRLRARTQFRARRDLPRHDARRPQPPRLRLAYGSRYPRAALETRSRCGGKANQLLRLSRDPHKFRRLPRLVRTLRSPRHLHHPAPPPRRQKKRMRAMTTKLRGTFRIAGPWRRAPNSG